MNGGSTFRVGLIQMRSERARRRATSTRPRKLIGEAKTGGADYVLTPEMTNIMESSREKLFADDRAGRERRLARDLPRACARARHLRACRLARREGFARQGGEPLVPDRPPRRNRRALRQDPHVRRRPAKAARAIASCAATGPGDLAVVTDLPWGRLGLTICYDLRFPALYRALAEAGAIFLAIPSAFTRQTGEAHWHVLMRARAIENGSFVFAAAQGGDHENGRATFGHSLVVDPWGRVIAEGGTEPGVVFADIDPAEVSAARGRIPSLQHGRRFEILEPMAEPTHLHVVGGDA